LNYGYNDKQGGSTMRSVVLDDEKANMCGICGSQEPYIEYKQLEGIDFIWCNKCHTITFITPPYSENKKRLIENEMNLYKHKEAKETV